MNKILSNKFKLLICFSLMMVMAYDLRAQIRHIDSFADSPPILAMNAQISLCHMSPDYFRELILERIVRAINNYYASRALINSPMSCLDNSGETSFDRLEQAVEPFLEGLGYASLEELLQSDGNPYYRVPSFRGTRPSVPTTRSTFSCPKPRYSRSGALMSCR